MSSGIDLGEGRADPIRVSLLYPSPYGLASEPRIDPTQLGREAGIPMCWIAARARWASLARSRPTRALAGGHRPRWSHNQHVKTQSE